jgi:hypothetical protein
LKNRYFKRLWVIQEVLLAREVHVLCGTIWLNMREMEQRYCKENKMVSLGGEDIPFVSLSLLWDGTHNRYFRSLAESIIKYSTNDCGNPGDKVCALQGLVKREQRIPVDYRKSILLVFLDAVDMLAKNHNPYLVDQDSYI